MILSEEEVKILDYIFQLMETRSIDVTPHMSQSEREELTLAWNNLQPFVGRVRAWTSRH